MAKLVENVPIAQAWQVWDVWAARAVENSPAPQPRQVALACIPVPVEYVPAEQDWQGWIRLVLLLLNVGLG
jgi:hypothetical protein